MLLLFILLKSNVSSNEWGGQRKIYGAKAVVGHPLILPLHPVVYKTDPSTSQDLSLCVASNKKQTASILMHSLQFSCSPEKHST